MTLNCNDALVDLSSPKILGILNLTPDSFYDGGKHQNIDAALQQCEKMIAEGADFIDLGAYSSRPGAEEVSPTEEIDRLLPVLIVLRKQFPTTLFSIDTFRANVAKAALEEGAHMINDISAGNLDPAMLSTVGKYPVPYIAMHMQGKPKDMQNAPSYEDVYQEIMRFFSEKINACYAAGINDVILDPGFGFGKTVEHNYHLLDRFERFQDFKLPVLAGVSRKSMIYKVLDTTPEESLNGTTVLHTVALIKKAQLIRVHDVKAAKECIRLLEELR